VERNTGDEEGQKAAAVERSTSTEENLPADDTKPDEDFEKDEVEDDGVEKEVWETCRLYSAVIMQEHETVLQVNSSHAVNSNSCSSFLVH